MKTYWGNGGIAPRALTSALDGAAWSATRPCRFTLRERSPCTHWIGGWVGPRAVLNTVVEKKIPSPESNPRIPIVQPVAQRYTDWAIMAVPPSSAKVKECVELYLRSPITPLWRGAQLKHRDNFTFIMWKNKVAVLIILSMLFIRLLLSSV
jgi:hypothetical protein